MEDLEKHEQLVYINNGFYTSQKSILPPGLTM